MRKSHLNDEFLVLLGPIISRFFACSNEEKINKPKQQRVCALVLSLCLERTSLFQETMDRAQTLLSRVMDCVTPDDPKAVDVIRFSLDYLVLGLYKYSVSLFKRSRLTRLTRYADVHVLH